MDGMRRGMQELVKNIKGANGTDLFTDDPNAGAYSCILCKKEYRRLELKVGDRTFRPLPACECVIEIRRKETEMRERLTRKQGLQQLYSQSIMNEKLKRASLDNFIPRTGSESALQAAKNFLRNFENEDLGLFFFGSVGNGKSHLQAAIHHSLDKQGYVSLFLDCSQLFNISRGTMHSGSKFTISDIVRSAVGCDLLTLDEIGSGYLTEFEFNDILLPIINGRQGKKTNYTSNLNLERLEQWFLKDKQGNLLDLDGRVFDRIVGSCQFYHNKASSYRQEMAFKRMRES